jgi:hypothetical protein
MYQNALEGHNQPPKLILSAAPIVLHHTVDNYVDVLNKVSGGVPNFGALAIDDSQNFKHSCVLFNDKVAKDIYGIILISGNIDPHFIYASFSPEYILPQIATITRTEGNVIKEINGLPMIRFLETLGLASDDKVNDILHSIPLILGYTDEDIPVSRVIEWIKEGHGVCPALIPEGTQFSIGTWNKSDVIDSAVRAVRNILSISNKNTHTLLLYSCLTRSYALGKDFLLEAEKVNETIADRAQYLFAYSGGEICPINEASTNSFHNNTIVACAF